MRPDRQQRLLRGSVAAAIATFAALLSHVAAGADFPSIAGIIAPLVLAIFVSVLLAGRTLSASRLLVAVATSQLFFHILFVAGTTSIIASGHAHGGPALVLTHAGQSADGGMWLSHAFAALVTTAVIYRGERAVLRVRHAVTALTVRASSHAVTTLTPPARPEIAVSGTSFVYRPAIAWRTLILSVPHRGPPVAV